MGVLVMTFGEALIQIMDEKGIKPAELARLSGVSKQTINELVKGRSKEPTFTKAKMLANGLGVPLQVLADMTDSEI
jgi:transcriptional regulator with XRE-family HTH domain